MTNLCYNKQALQSNFIDGSIAKKKNKTKSIAPAGALKNMLHGCTKRVRFYGVETIEQINNFSDLFS